MNLHIPSDELPLRPTRPAEGELSRAAQLLLEFLLSLGEDDTLVLLDGGDLVFLPNPLEKPGA